MSFPFDLSILRKLEGVVNPVAHRLSLKHDPLVDKRWFKHHPAREERCRPPSELETTAYGLPPLSFVLVFRLSRGNQGRLIFAPKADLAEAEENALSSWLQQVWAEGV